MTLSLDKTLTYRISSYKTRGYYFFARPSTAGIIRMRVLIEGWYYYQYFVNLEIKTRNATLFEMRNYSIQLTNQ